MVKEYDVIVVGTGPGGATVAKDLSEKGRRVLILEAGSASLSANSALDVLRSLRMAKVSKGLFTVSAQALGGTSNIYFAAVGMPPLDQYEALGIDLGPSMEAAKQELPFAPLADHLISDQVQRVASSARQLGYNWTKTDAMLIDQSKCESGYCPDSKWNSKSFVSQAIKSGAELIDSAKVVKVLNQDGVACGVRYQKKSGLRKVFEEVRAQKVVLAAGSLSSPKILLNSGVEFDKDQGFYCDPGFVVMGFCDDLNGEDLFSGSMGDIAPVDRLLIADGCMAKSFFKPFVISHGKLHRLYSHRRCVSVGVMIHDQLSGRIDARGVYNKEFTQEEHEKLQRGGTLAHKIIENAGGKGVFWGNKTASHVGGVLPIGSAVDNHLQTTCENLFVCDNSIIPESIRVPPTFSLACLGKYLAEKL